ncbi:hypothetical protein ABL78_8504, partial [Leptomonas seymouri]
MNSGSPPAPQRATSTPLLPLPPLPSLVQATSPSATRQRPQSRISISVHSSQRPCNHHARGHQAAQHTPTPRAHHTQAAQLSPFTAPGAPSAPTTGRLLCSAMSAYVS